LDLVHADLRTHLREQVDVVEGARDLRQRVDDRFQRPQLFDEPLAALRVVPEVALVL
jgi:hypothetical protein